MAQRTSDSGLARFNGTLWSLVRSRIETTCLVSGRTIRKGDQVYRPVTNGITRRLRIIKGHMPRNAVITDRPKDEG